MSWFYYKVLLISLGITLGLFLAYQGYKYFVSTVRKNEVYVPRVVLHAIENRVATGLVVFHFEVKDEQPILFEICDTDFKPIKELKKEHLTAGAYTLTFDTTTLANGDYFYRVSGSEQQVMKKMHIRN